MELRLADGWTWRPWTHGKLLLVGPDGTTYSPNDRLPAQYGGGRAYELAYALAYAAGQLDDPRVREFCKE